MKLKRLEDYIGVGLYTPAEAAYYAGVSTSLVTRWIHGNANGFPVVNAQIENEGEKIISFLDLIQALAIRAIRKEMEVPLQTIREGVMRIKSEFNLEYPFARAHKTYIFNKQVIIVLAFTLDQGHPKSHIKPCLQKLKEEGKIEYQGNIGYSFNSCLKVGHSPLKNIRAKKNG